MPLITRLANAIRKDNPADLFCLVEFGDKGHIVCFSSGNGRPPNGPNIDQECRGRPGRVTFHEGRSSADGEERMTWYFSDYWKGQGKATDITIITAASPCSEVCAPALRRLIEELAGDVRTWTILYHKPYWKKSDLEKGGGFQRTLELLNFQASGVKAACFQLHGDFIDKDTYHSIRQK